jgi:hypothetical protein
MKGEAAQEYYLGGVGRNISPKKTLVRIVNRTDEKRTAAAAVSSTITQYAMKEAMRFVEPDPAESEAIRRALFTGSYPAIQLSTFEQRPTSCRSHQNQVEEEQVSTYEARVFTRNTIANQIYGLNNIKLKVVGR